jgi:hypothetical protein
MLYGQFIFFKKPWMAATYDTYQFLVAYGCFKYNHIKKLKQKLKPKINFNLDPLQRTGIFAIIN